MSFAIYRIDLDAVDLVAEYTLKWMRRSSKGDQLVVIVPNVHIRRFVESKILDEVIGVQMPNSIFLSKNESIVRLVTSEDTLEKLRGLRIKGYIYFPIDYIDLRITGLLAKITENNSSLREVNDMRNYKIIMNMEGVDYEN